MFGRSTGTFDRFLEKATSQLLLEPDWDSILNLCDCIRQEDVQPKYAVSAVKKKVGNENPHVSMFALQTLESMVKNCGSLVHEHIATKEFMEFMKETTVKKPEPVKGKLLELVQVWSHAFRNEPSYKIVQDTYNLMKMEGHQFPQLKESDAMFSAERAPEWKDGETCYRCKTAFGTFNRKGLTLIELKIKDAFKNQLEALNIGNKHHCRNCGQVFCSKCSSKNSIIPKFGIEREVRVCDACYEVLNKAEGKEDDLPAEYLASPLSQQSQSPPTKSEQEIQEEEELQLALALSKSEAEAQKGKKQPRKSANYSLYGNTKTNNEPARAPDPVVTAPTFDTSEMDPELARYLNRNYWQQKSENLKQEPSSTQPSAPVAAAEPKNINAVTAAPASGGGMQKVMEEVFQNGEDDQNREQFLQALQSSIQIFMNRMKSNHSRGRSIANDSAVQTLFMTINQMHPQLLQFIQEQEDVRARYENLQDKLAQLKDAREALDVLREEHREKRRREQEEMERQRAIQMAHKLEVLRQKKQEYLEYQRQLALQRMEEQKREMQMRLEQQKQMQMQRAMQYGMASLQTQQMYGLPGQSPAGSAEGSPMHHPHMQQTPYGAPTHPGGMMMGPPPGAPGSHMMPPGATINAAGGPPMSMPPVTAMGVPPGAGGMGGPPVSQGMYGQQQPGYQPPGGYAPAGYHPGQPQSSYGVPTTAQQQPGYSTAPMTGDYHSFNMQNLATSLPPGQPPVTGQHPPGQPPLQQGQQQPQPPQNFQQPMGAQQGQNLQQQSMGQPPSMVQGQQLPGQQQQPVSGLAGIPSGQQSMVSQQAPGQPAMGQPGMMGGPGIPVTHPGMPTQQQPGMVAQLPGQQQYMGQPSAIPPQAAPGQPGMGMPQQQGMMGQPPASMQQPQQQFMGGPLDQYQQAPPPGQQAPSGQQQAPPMSQGQQDVAELISFD